MADALSEWIRNWNLAWLVHVLVVDVVGTLAVVSCTYSLSCVLFRFSILENITADEWTQFFASFLLGVAILLSEWYEDPLHSPQYDNAMDYVKAVVLLALMRWTFVVQIRGPMYNPDDSVDLTHKVVIVTGSTSGIGLETAQELARANPSATVIIACRDVKKGEQVRKEILRNIARTASRKPSNLVVEELDLESFDSVRRFAKRISESYNAVDILINNAGAMLLERRVTKENGFETMMQTNCLASFLLTTLLLPKLRASTLQGGPRIVNVSSTTGKLHKRVLWDDMQGEKYYSMLYTYGHSKFCLNQMTVELSKKFRQVAPIVDPKSKPVSDEKLTILVNGCHPGAVRTGVTRHLHWFLQFGANFIIAMINKDAFQGAQTILYLATSKRLLKDGGKEGRPVSGKFFEHSQMCETPLLDSEQEREKLFKYCEAKTGIRVDDLLA